MYFAYGILLGVWFVLTSPFWWWQRLRHGKHQGVRERLGRVPERIRASRGNVIWVHAVSVGEVLAVTPVVEELRRRHPKFRVVVSTVTDTGQKLARQRFGEENVFYFPVDFAFAVRSYVEALRPSLVVVAETEFWPNFWRIAKGSGAQIAVINARISDRSFPGYKRVRGLLRRVLAKVDVFLAQTAQDRDRLISIGAAKEAVRISGNLKFELTSKGAPALVGRLRSALNAGNAGPLLVCGSTVETEEAIVISAFEEVLRRYGNAVMVLAPRHPERFAGVVKVLEASGVKFWRRSLWKDEAMAGGVFLLDSIGELASIYGLADVAFVGGSLVPRGGHNILEPASAGVATLVGPYTENFRDIVNLFRSKSAVRVVTTETLGTTFVELLENDVTRAELGRRASEIFKANAGAKEKTLAALDELMREVRPQWSGRAEPAPVASSRRV